MKSEKKTNQKPKEPRIPKTLLAINAVRFWKPKKTERRCQTFKQN